MKNRTAILLSSVFVIICLFVAGSYLYINHTTIGYDDLQQISENEARANYPAEYEHLIQTAGEYELAEDREFKIYHRGDTKELQLYGNLTNGNSFTASIPVQEQASNHPDDDEKNSAI